LPKVDVPSWKKVNISYLPLADDDVGTVPLGHLMVEPPAQVTV
jgi:hypothetical protein